MLMRISTLLVALATATLYGCSTTGTPVVGNAAADAQPTTAALDSMQINDISLPPEARLDAANTLMIGSGDRWFGRVAIKTSTSAVQVFNHFHSGMPALGWRLLSALQSNTSLLVFQRGERIAMIQIESAQWGGTTATVSVSLQEQGMPKPMK
ncbi:MAG: hypothetical protein RBS28_12425 [Rhodocyclaceae bacterium]|jgi:hypothetical protein|nr:hypothetical protein [Rhodocyclaceae bacterium]